MSVEDRTTSNPPNRVNSDVVGPMKERSIERFKYFVTLLYECSGLSLQRFMAKKIYADDAVMEIVLEPENAFNY